MYSIEIDSFLNQAKASEFRANELHESASRCSDFLFATGRSMAPAFPVAG